MRLFARLVAALTFGILVAACTPKPNPTNTTRIGPEGGSLTLGGATLRIPAGALAEATDLTVAESQATPPAGVTTRSSVFQFGPDGLQFQVPAELDLEFTGSPDNVALYWTSASGSGFDRIPGTISGTVLDKELDVP